jgi:hypothetical protein
VDSLPAYNNEEEYKKSAVALFGYFLSVADNQYKKLLQYVEDPDLDNKVYKEKIQSLFKEISLNEKPYDIRFNTAEDNYMKKYGIRPDQ